MSITVYSQDGCTQCTQTTRAMDRQGVKYDVVKVVAGSVEHEQIIEWGFRGFPVVDAVTARWSGFDLDKIKSLQV